MESTRIGPEGPRLEGVFGPLSVESDSTIRAGLRDLGDRLLLIAAQADCHSDGMKLHSNRSGQLSIAGVVGVTVPGGRAVNFMVELRPDWYYGAKTGRPGWEIETSVDADSSDPSGNNVMSSVHTSTASASTAIDAVRVLAAAVDELVALVTDYPLSHWADLGEHGLA